MEIAELTNVWASTANILLLITLILVGAVIVVLVVLSLAFVIQSCRLSPFPFHSRLMHIALAQHEKLESVWTHLEEASPQTQVVLLSGADQLVGPLLEQTETETCAICLETENEDCRRRRIRVCGHAFHSDCIDQWLEQGKYVSLHGNSLNTFSCS